MRFLIKIVGPINSRELWEHIKIYKVNLTDFTEVAYVYGEASFADSIYIIEVCALYGDLYIELFGPR